MPDFGWDPIIVTTSDWYSSVPMDSTFNDEVAHAITIRTRAFTRNDWLRMGHLLWRGLMPILARLGKDEAWLVEGLRWRLEKTLFFPDDGVTWLPYAVYQGLRAVRKYKPELIYATAPPFSTLITGWLVSKISGLPLVVDLRDLWVDNPGRLINGRIKRKMDAWLEELCLASAAAIITTTRTGADLLRRKYRKKIDLIYTIYNGYDEKDFANYPRSVQVKESSETLTISHVGSLYGDRNPVPFLLGLSTFLKRKSDERINLKVRFVGKVSSFSDSFKEYERQGVLEVDEPVEHPEAIEIMARSTVLLLIMPYGSQKVVYAKLFEYLASGRPILGILPLDGEVAELLRRTGNTWIVDVNDVEGISRCLTDIWETWRQGNIRMQRNQEYVRTFERSYLTSQLCKIFASIADFKQIRAQ
jgi:glycosyltransferase involved in cell wall biosynthesis